MENRVIYGYTLLRKLGVGGMAEVWYAENSIGKVAAVKILAKKLSDEENIVERFEKEARIMVKLTHPNIRQVYNYGTIDDRPCIIMEYLEGEDLASLIKKGTVFTQTQIIKWWNQMVSALMYTHRLGIVHRDIKPSNIFITKEGDVELLDFGIAKVADSCLSTFSGMSMGTPMYMSPEQVVNSKHVDYRSDLYSLAVTFVHLLKGKSPYTSDLSVYSLYTRIVEEPLDVSGIAHEWQTFLKPYLSKKPENRPELREFVCSEAECKESDWQDSNNGTFVEEDGTKVENRETKKEWKTVSTSPDSDAIKSNTKLKSIKEDKTPVSKVVLAGIVAGVILIFVIVLLVLHQFNRKETVDNQLDILAHHSDSLALAQIYKDSLAKIQIYEDSIYKAKEVAKQTMAQKSNDKNKNKKQDIKHTKYHLSVSSITIYESEEASIDILNEYNSKMASESVVWWSSSEDIASIDKSGIITAHKVGSATINARLEDQELNCSVQVVSNPNKVMAYKTQYNFNSTFIEMAQGLNMKMVYVEGGEFNMGATSEQGSDYYDNEKPVRRVKINSFHIAECEISQEQWTKIMGTSIDYFTDIAYGVGPSYPMHYVSFDDAQAFCRELSRITGKTYALTTEAQWEYAARGGRKNEVTKYSGSANVDAVAWYSDNSNGSAHPVKRKIGNELGIYDMSGNVMEWCKDWYSNSYDANDYNNPKGVSYGTYRVLRGGSWNYGKGECRVSSRNFIVPDARNRDVGFRVVVILN